MFEVTDEGTPNEKEEELHAEYVRTFYSVFITAPNWVSRSIETTGLVAHVDLFAVNPPRAANHKQVTGYRKPSSALTAPSDHNWEHHPHNLGNTHNSQREENTVEIDEAAVLTPAIFGSSFVHAVKVQDMAGETVILFVFAVRQQY
jgi:hypothetical protein